MKYILAGLTAVLLLIPILAIAAQPAPPFPSGSNRWLDGKELSWDDLKGKVVLLNVWTFACWNSYRSLPWIVELEKKYPDLQVIGVHSPEFEHEKDRDKLRSAMAKYGISYPQLLDDSHEYWNALSNRYWPAFYVVDRSGRIRGKYFGETHVGDSQAREMEKLVGQLLSE